MSLAELSREEELLSRKVDALLSNANNFSRSLQKLDLLRVQAQSTQVVSAALLSTLETTASTAERISSNVRSLDAEQSRVKETLKYVEEVKDLKASVSGVHQSMESQNWELAAEHIHRASVVPESIARGKFSALMVPTSETPLNPMETIREASDSLYILFTREFKSAVAARDPVQITRFFKLFPHIGKAKEGLQLYAEFVSSIVAERTEAALNTASTSPILYATLMTGLFENIAKLITNHTPLITRFYGQNIDAVLLRIQEECDKQGILILTTMAEDRQLGKKVSEIKSYSFSFLVQSFLPAAREVSSVEEREVDTKALDALLTETSIIFTRWSLYKRFIDRCSTEKLEESALSKYIGSKLESNYETMEGYFMRRSVERAFQLENIEQPSGYEISSVVDDTMFILRKVTTRALSTCQIQTLSSIFAVVRRILEQDYAGVLGRRMQDLQARISSPSGVVRSIDFEKRDQANYCTLLNNLDVSANHVSRIIDEHLKSPSLEYYEDAVKVIETFNSLTERFSRGLEDGVNVVFTAYIKLNVTNAVNEILTQEYMLNQQTYEEAQLSDKFYQRLVKHWGHLMGQFEKIMSPNAYLLLLRTTVRAFIRVLEKKMLTLKCNELGAIRLDKDVHAIINHVSGTYTGIRERFERVREISNVVNWSNEDEDERYDGNAEAIIAGLGLKKIGKEEIEMIRSLVRVE